MSEAAAAGALLEVFATGAAIERQRRLLAGVPITEVGDRALAALADTVTPQGLVGVARTVDVSLAAALTGAPRLVAVLLDVRDPGNAGTVIRSADAAGADAVVLAVGADGGAVDPYNGKCVRASAGSVFHLPLVLGVALTDVLAAVREAGLTVLAAAGRAELDLDSLLDEGTLSDPTAWVFGTEAHGLADEVVARCDRAVRVPIHGRAESLNLASAATVCLYASARAQRTQPPSR